MGAYSSVTSRHSRTSRRRPLLRRLDVSRPLAEGNEDPGYEGGPVVYNASAHHP